MPKEDYSKMSLIDLCDLLVIKTQSRLEAIHGKADEATVQSCTKEVELIQKMITNRKKNFSPNSFP